MNFVHLRSVLALTVLLLAGAAAAQEAPPDPPPTGGDGFIAVMNDPLVAEDVRQTVNEFAVDYLKQGGKLSLRLTRAQLKPHMTTKCLSDFACLQKVRKELKLDRLFVAVVSKIVEGGYRFEVLRVDELNYRFGSAGSVKEDKLDVAVSGIVTAVHDLIKAELPKASLTILAEGEASQEVKFTINGTPVGEHGQYTGKLKRGKYTVIAHHPNPEFLPKPYKVRVELKPGESKTLRPKFKRKEVPKPEFITKDNSSLKLGLEVGGWTSLGLGFASGLTALALHFKALDLQEGLDTGCRTVQGIKICDPGLEGDSDTIAQYQDAVLPLSITAGVLGAAGVTLLVYNVFVDEEERIPVEPGVAVLPNGSFFTTFTTRF